MHFTSLISVNFVVKAQSYSTILQHWQEKVNNLSKVFPLVRAPLEFRPGRAAGGETLRGKLEMQHQWLKPQHPLYLLSGMGQVTYPP